MENKDNNSSKKSDKFNLPDPELEYMSHFEVELESGIYELGQTSDLGARRIIPITGGRFDGPLLSGNILNNGADWQIVTGDGLAIIDTRYLLQTHDGTMIYLQTKGFRHGPPEVLKELTEGNPVDPRKYYFRVYMHFETAGPQYKWLNRTMGIGIAMRLGGSVVYDAYRII